MKRNIGILFILALIISASIYFYRVYYKTYYLTVTGIVEHADGIGRQVIDFEELVGDEIEMNSTSHVHTMKFVPKRFKKVQRIHNKKLGYVVLNEHTFPFDFVDDKDYDDFIFKLTKFKTKINRRFSKLLNITPREEQIFIAYSMFESDRLPQYWAYKINKDWDMVVVPDKNLVDIYVNSGVKKPIFVVPLGTNLESHLNAPLKKKANKIFTFANFSAIQERKNSLKLLEAYHNVFKDNDNVRLLLSARKALGNTYSSLKKYIFENNVRGVEIDLGAKNSSFYNFTFDDIDCYVSPSKGEGFSVIPREAMARGIPVIVSDSLAQKTIAQSGLVRSIEANKLVPGYYSHADMFKGNFVDIETKDLEEAMLDVYNNYQTYLDKSQDARDWVEKGQYKHLKNLYMNMVKPKNIILGDRNEITEDYLMTNSQELYDKWKHLEKKGLL